MEVAVLVQRAEHRPGGGRPLFLRVVVMLDADAAEERMQVVRHVSRREYVWNIGAASGVAHPAVVEGLLGPLEDVDVRLDADRHDREVTVKPSTALGDGMLDPLCALEAYDLVMCDQCDPGVAMDAGEQLTHLGSQDGIERGIAGKHRGHGQPHLTQRSGDLRSDETHAHHQGPAALLRNSFDRITIAGCAQPMDARQVSPGIRRRLFRPPVAISSLPYGMTSPVSNSIRLSLVSRLTAVARTTSTSFFSNHWAGLTSQPDRSSSPRRYVLESGGRPNGTPGSFPRRTRRLE